MTFVDILRVRSEYFITDLNKCKGKLPTYDAGSSNAGNLTKKLSHW